MFLIYGFINIAILLITVVFIVLGILGAILALTILTAGVIKYVKDIAGFYQDEWNRWKTKRRGLK